MPFETSNAPKNQNANEDTSRCCASFKCGAFACWIIFNLLLFLGGGVLLTYKKITTTTALAFGIPLGVLTVCFAICGCFRPKADLAFGFFQPNNANNHDALTSANERTPLGRATINS